MPEKSEIITAYTELRNIPAQQQNLPGLDKNMEPIAKWTELEAWDNDGNPYLVEYKGSGKLKDKAAIITGGDSGIGRAAALMFAREGAEVTIVYLPQEEEDAQKVKQSIESEGGKCLTIAGNLEDDEFPEKLVKKHVDTYGKLNILVNNASKQVQNESITDVDIKMTESIFKSNIIQMIALSKYAVPHMKRGGSIINTSSVTALKGSPAMVDYSSTKGAILSFTKSLALQLAPKGIRVNAVLPGPVHTPLQPASRPAEQMEDFQVGKLPLWGRALQPAEMGPAYVYLASADSNAMTGGSIDLNAGQYFH